MNQPKLRNLHDGGVIYQLFLRMFTPEGTLQRAKELLRGFDGELLILDELNIAVRRGYLDAAEVAAALSGRRAGLNVIVTGRGAAPELLEIADLVSEIRAVRHPFLNGEPARKGLDY